MKSCLFLLLFLSACTVSESTAKTVLESAGYTRIILTGYSAFACNQSDTFSTGFRARGLNGNYVKGTVCCGVTKNCTIRLEP